MAHTAELGIAPQGVYRVVEEALGAVKGVRILDMPCASGRLSGWLAGQGADCVALDRVRPLHYARAVQADMNLALPFRDESFDYVLCLEGIEHSQSPFQLAREAYRILRPGGRLILSTPNIHNVRSRLKFLCRGTLYWFDSREVTGVGHISVMPLFILRHLIHEAGFSDVRLDTIGTVRPWLPRWLAGVFQRITSMQSASDDELNSLPVLNGEGFVVCARKAPIPSSLLERSGVEQ